MVTVRIASIDDAPSLLEIYGYYVANTAITFECKVPTLGDFKERMRSTLEVYPYLVAEDEGRIIGYVYANRFRPREAYDWAVKLSIYIRKEYHRKGIGRLLYGLIEDILRRQNIANVYATIVEPLGESDDYLTGESTRFHEAMGYRRVAVYHGCGNKFGRWYDLVETEKIIADKNGPPKEFIPFPKIVDPLNPSRCCPTVTCFLCDCSPLQDDVLFNEAYSVLSDRRKEKADRCSSRNERNLSVAAGLFIRLVERDHGDVVEDENGKLHSSGMEFSISHSGNYVVFAYSKSPIGVDIERIGRGKDIGKRVMTSSEFDEYSKVKERDREDLFCRMWTAKESYMKYLGLGFRLPPESFKVLYGCDLKSPEDSVSFIELQSPEGYRLTVCSADKECISKNVTVEKLIIVKSLGSL